MNDKIINGIDVSEEHKNCKYRFKGKSCEDCPLNCKFKRLEQENKELKEKITKFRWDNPYYDLYNNVVGQRDNLEKENEELKEKIDIYENSIIANHDRAVGKRLMEVLLALEEIRSYCDEQNLKADYTACYITNRINEVLND